MRNSHRQLTAKTPRRQATKKINSLLSVTVSVFGCLLCGITLASTLIPRDLPELVQHADRIVVGRCLRTTSFWEDGLILTRFEIAVEETLKGTVTKTAEFVTPGGKVGEMRMEVGGAPASHEGERMLVFLARNPSGRMRIFGAAQGKFDLVKDPETGVWMATNSLVEVKSLEVREDRGSVIGGARGSRLPLKDLVSTIRVWVARGGPR